MRNLLLPAAEKRKQFELRALGLREFAGVTEDQPLDPFALASFAKLLVVDFNSIEGLSEESRAHLLGAAADEWSGGACSRPLPNGWRVVILNPAHGSQRNRATLMEEVAHVFLGHKANRLAAITADERPSGHSQGSGKEPRGRMLARDYNQLDEEAAYAVGAAALVPFGALRRHVLEGRNSREIARHFRVSRQLIEYRIKVTLLWPGYKRLSATRPEHV
ncbi:MAG TPA: ImmA/IrrE family metallo-endopeptidase [Pyrinomonadaceae bacterium]|nr:ImmA/IrrE family metallo-endopeptidase [Pyrinomonadaceae bacterium]